MERLRPQMETFAPRHTAFRPGVESEIVGQTVVEMAGRLDGQSHRYPRSWFSAEAPAEADRSRFRALAWLICRRRIYDLLRREYAERRLRLPASDPTYSAETHAADREALRRVIAAIDELEPEDRELLIRGMERGDGELPLTSRERVRLSRLRSRLIWVANPAATLPEEG